MKQLAVFFLSLLLYTATAQTKNTSAKLPDELLNFFIGNWSGEGAFYNGKKIAADLSFRLTLDSSWIIYDHTDKQPSRYKSTSMWSIDAKSGEFTAYMFDNSFGHRKFISDGWKDGKLILTSIDYAQTRGVLFQHLIYEKQSDTSFKMTYETSKDGLVWRLGDYLLFTKRNQ
ncbi:MAG: hypothetical protein J0I09_14665 [Sphingobacteriia bacterium]|nr:hypothetical protein [Sphingobacteriia bacterium]